MLRNTRTDWGSVSKALHWITVLLILLEVPAGFLMSSTYGLSLRDKEGLALNQFAAQIHHTNGFLILALTGGRLVWRLLSPPPVVSRLSGVQRRASHVSHYGLYALLVLLPLSGWAALSVFGESPIWLFNRPDIMPAILPKLPVKDPHGYGFFAGIHAWCYELGAAILTLHIGAALWHHFAQRDNTLVRMWPLGRRENKPAAPADAQIPAAESRSTRAAALFTD